MKNQNEAISSLKERLGIDYREFCGMFDYKFSPEALLHALMRHSAATERKVEVYYKRKNNEL